MTKQTRNKRSTEMAMPKRGRKSLLTPALRKQVCRLLERGHTIATVSAAGGFSERSFFDWCEKNAAFLAETQRARAAGRVRIIESILADRDWRAKAWYLERTDPGQYGRVAERPPPSPSVDDEGKQLGVAVYLNCPDGLHELKQFPVIREVEKDKLTDSGGEDGELADGEENVDEDEPSL